MAEEHKTSRRRIRWPLVLVAFVGFFFILDAIWPGKAPPKAPPARLHVLATFLPMRIFAANVIQGVPGVALDVLVTRETSCPHSYSLTGEDLKKISDADVLVANGLGVEPFLDQFKKTNPKAPVLTVSDDCDLLHLSEAQMHEEEAEQAGHHHADEEVESDINPHTWMSPRQAIKQVRTLGRKLGEVDPQYAARYRANAEAYAARLQLLADKMAKAAQSFKNRNIATGHPAFDYLARDLGLKVVATVHIIPGETGSAAEMAHAIDTVRSKHAAAIFSEFGSGDREAATIGRDAGVRVYPLSTITSVKDANVPASVPVTRLYEAMMERNLATLQEALGAGAASSGSVD